MKKFTYTSAASICCILLLSTTIGATNAVVSTQKHQLDDRNSKDLIAGATASFISRDKPDTSGSGGSHHLRRTSSTTTKHNQKDTVRRKLQDTDEDITIGGSSTTSNGTTSSPSPTLCKSVIAIGGTKRIEHRSDVDDASDATDLLSRRTLQETYEEDGDIEHPYRSDDYIYETDEEFVCELDNGDTIPLQGTNEQISEMRMLLNQGALVSSESTVAIASIGSVYAADELEGGIAGVTTADGSGTVVTLPPGSIQLDNSNVNNEENNRRRLNMYEGPKKALVVRVTDRSGRGPAEDANYLSDKIFGSYGDSVTMASGFKACTFGKLTFTSDSGSSTLNNKMDAPGVVDIRINEDLTKIDQSQLRSLILKEVKNKLGVSLPNVFDHVMCVVEKCYQNSVDSCSWAAYAFVNSWFSMYQQDNYKFPGVTMHEVGHNLNFAHSGGLDSRTYTDHTVRCFLMLSRMVFLCLFIILYNILLL